MSQLLLATTNPGKIREIVLLLAGVPFDLVTLADRPAVEAPAETGRTFGENARIKATYYAAGAAGVLTVAEDSGLEIDALDRQPGVESARYGGIHSTYADKFALINRELAARGALRPAARSARFVCALAVAAGNAVVFETTGTVEGEIAASPRGAAGFGYDPIFLFPPYQRTLAEVTRDEKLAVAHRGKAFRDLAGWLRARSTDTGTP